jgi:gliding motility-associated-like protein
VWPGADEVDSGFDLLRLVDPGPVDTEGVEVRIGGLSVPPTQVSLEGDSLLLIALPNSIKRDSVEISFTTKVLRNAQVFSIDLGSSERPGLWQSVEPTARRADQVFLPDLVGSDALIGDLVIAPAVFTPNGDGINDAVEIRFVVFKVIETQPRVRIFDLAGHQIAILNQPPGGDDQTYTWSGEDENGELVPPGTYLCHIDLEAEAGDRTALRSLAVAY